MEPDVTVIRPVKPGKETEKSGLADAIGPDQADAIAGLQFKANIVEQQPLIEAASKAGTA